MKKRARRKAKIRVVKPSATLSLRISPPPLSEAQSTLSTRSFPRFTRGVNFLSAFFSSYHLSLFFNRQIRCFFNKLSYTAPASILWCTYGAPGFPFFFFSLSSLGEERRGARICLIFRNLRVSQKNSSASADGSLRNDWAKRDSSERGRKKYSRREGNLSYAVTNNI